MRDYETSLDLERRDSPRSSKDTCEFRRGVTNPRCLGRNPRPVKSLRAERVVAAAIASPRSRSFLSQGLCAIPSFRSSIFPHRLPRLPFDLSSLIVLAPSIFPHKARSSFYSPARSRPRRVSFFPAFLSFFFSFLSSSHTHTHTHSLPRVISMELIPGAVRKGAGLSPFPAGRNRVSKGFLLALTNAGSVCPLYTVPRVISQNERYPALSLPPSEIRRAEYR